MRRSILLFVLLTISTILKAQNANYVVQIGAFDKRVGVAYFDKFSGVIEAKDPYDIYHYYLSAKDAADAERVRKEAVAAGYTNARVVDIEKESENCNLACSFSPNVPQRVDVTTLKSIFFDFDSYGLRGESKLQLNRLVMYLEDNPTCTAELRAHTDGKGSNEYNERLSINRATAAKNYCVSKGIPASKLTVKTFGEASPIAKNELPGGSDTEQGRQFNRRVELVVLDANGKPLNVVEEIKVPDGLKAN